MKTNEERIFAFLTAFSNDDVRNGIRLWRLANIEENREEAENSLRGNGWYSIGTEKPENTEFHFINGEYWIQDEEVHKHQMKVELEKKEQAKSASKDKGTKESKQKAMMGGIKKTEMKCPTCNHTMYKEPICPSCKEGKSGYKIRLMCENNPDHEVLL